MKRIIEDDDIKYKYEEIKPLIVIIAIINLIKLVITYLCKQKELKHTAKPQYIKT